MPSSMERAHRVLRALVGSCLQSALIAAGLGRQLYRLWYGALAAWRAVILFPAEWAEIGRAGCGNITMHALHIGLDVRWTVWQTLYCAV